MKKKFKNFRWPSEASIPVPIFEFLTIRREKNQNPTCEKNELSFKLPSCLVLYRSSLILNIGVIYSCFRIKKKLKKYLFFLDFYSMKRYRRPELEKSSSSESDPDEPLYVPLKERRKAKLQNFKMKFSMTIIFLGL